MEPVDYSPLYCGHGEVSESYDEDWEHRSRGLMRVLKVDV